MKKTFVALGLIVYAFSLKAQTHSVEKGELFAMLESKEGNGNFDGLTRSYQKHFIVSKLSFHETSSKNRSFLKFRLRRRQKQLLGVLVANTNLVADRKTNKKKCFGLNAKTVIAKHSKELEVLNGSNCKLQNTYEHLCLNLPQRSEYKGEEMPKGTVQEEAIVLGRLPFGLYLLEAWSLGE